MGGVCSSVGRFLVLKLNFFLMNNLEFVSVPIPVPYN